MPPRRGASCRLTTGTDTAMPVWRGRQISRTCTARSRAAGFFQPPINRPNSTCERREPGEQRRILKHDATIKARSVDRVAVEQHFAAALTHQTSDDLQECALATAARAEDAEEFVALDGQRPMVERVVPAELYFVEVSTSIIWMTGGVAASSASIAIAALMCRHHTGNEWPRTSSPVSYIETRFRTVSCMLPKANTLSSGAGRSGADECSGES